ncbi:MULTISPECIES: ABC transporter substrate-binding protein [Streptomyces]|uniref:ABC transporter substrate-binding protein n=1 Tax=Streptomyces rhizosphaericola TaxID=2564098 RepID=A0ABY2PBG3_9ACTN|nr:MULTISPECIES: ABC transporter substrate-binding protein [Streptomyces]ARI56256.1 ABC transporter substrate-binding protein [Streptomyces sp. S8]MYT98954.1 ABC transporter substrate-binding protein [Streptomyces sp. SID8350]NGO84549.1 ABC transporter substrate-binding protein [Streptomyces sp. 196(2019)]TGZ04498.1 ABC transporter substrate-binding protein [Streptomyces rhizosphaericola]SCK23830.1 osmoprotectant transport system substrate-binding protein [Streptomyces sp. AmelKG-D3]
MIPGRAATPSRALARRAVAGLVVLTATATACATGPSLENQGEVTAPPGDSRELTIGSAGFTESDLLAQLYALLLERAGYAADILSVTNREIYEPALESGQIDVVPEYAATFADWLNAKANGADATPVGSPDLAATMKALRALAAPRGLTVLDPGRAVDQNAFAVAASYARKHGLRTLSDLGAAKLPVRLAAGDECVQRPYCAPGLRKTYGIDIVAVDPKGVGTTPAKQAVQNGQDQMVLTTTTDATLDRFGLVLLADDKKLQNADYVVPVVNRARAGSDRVRDALGRLNTVLTTADLASMNQQVDSWRRLPEDVARNYLESKKLIPKE